MLAHYIIKQKTELVTGEFDGYGKLCTRVIEGNMPLLVDLPPNKVLIESTNYYGSNLKGAIEGAKTILGNIHLCPFMVSQNLDICLFPNKSSVHHDCIWFNHEHVLNTWSQGRYTIVEFRNGNSLKLRTRQASFNSKKQKAGDLRRILTERVLSGGNLEYVASKQYGICKETGKLLFYKGEHEND
ncbi:competence protein ComK [Mesobacillus foraminis]|uniref:competence protein ComK n=1 Tax=Mesobacillus foraminis TaxID=279826 RepID=UPI0039A034AF